MPCIQPCFFHCCDEAILHIGPLVGRSVGLLELRGLVRLCLNSYLRAFIRASVHASAPRCM